MIARVSDLPDSELICECNQVPKGAIVAAIREQRLSTREQIATSTRAATGCGSCAQLVDDLLRETCLAKAPSAAAGSPPLRAAAPEPASFAAAAPRSYPKNLDIGRIKKEGLALDFAKIREKGVQALSDDDYYRLKTYGVCSQKHPEFFMLRIRVPGGCASAAQLERLAEAARYYGRGGAHLTTRQDIELHWVRLSQLPEIWEQLEEAGLTSRSSCGHTVRNVMACPHSGIHPASVMDVAPWAKAVSDYFVSRSEHINPSLPNRINIFFAGCPECAPQAQINDIGLLAASRPANDGGAAELGFELWAGGSLGAYPLLGVPLRTFLRLGEVLPACQALFQIYMERGGGQKGKTRLKFLIEEMGRQAFVELFETVFQHKKSLPENRLFPLPVAVEAPQQRSVSSWLGEKMAASHAARLPPNWRPQRQEGFAWTVVHVPLGELHARQLEALARIAGRYCNGEVRFNADQDVELHWVRPKSIANVELALQHCGLSLRQTGRGPRITACPGTEFCHLAVTNAQGAARDLIGSFDNPSASEQALLQDATISISGCPNSCAKHQAADIGLGGGLVSIGSSRRYAYQIYVGGGMQQEARLGSVVRRGLTEDRVVPAVRALVGVASRNRQPGESFQEVMARLGPEEVSRLLDEHLSLSPVLKSERVVMCAQETEA